MARGSRYNIVKDKIHVGMKSFGNAKNCIHHIIYGKEMQKHQDTLSENVFQ